MLLNYLKIAFRNIYRNRLFTIINISGLAVALSCVFIIFLFIEYELGFDDFHRKKDNIYRIVKQATHQNGTNYESETPFPLVHSLRLDYPDLVCTRFFNRQSANITIEEDVYMEPNIMFVDSVFFKIFNYRWINGSPGNSLANPSSVVLTQNLAEKYFPDEDPIGKIITIKQDYRVKVTGVIENPPRRSSMPFTMILPLEFINEKFLGYDHNRWSLTVSGFEAYVLLPPHTDPGQFEPKMQQSIMKYLEGRQAETDMFHLQQLDNIHLDPRFGSVSNTYTISKTTLRVFALIGILIISIAVINFVNLATAQAIKRSREVGVRKTLGASGGNIRIQFMMETATLTLSAVVLAVVITEIFIPHLNDFLGRGYQLGIYRSHYIWIFLAVIFVLVSLLTGFYPAMILSRYKPQDALKGEYRRGRSGSFGIRNALVVFQFIISVVLIIAALTIHRQIGFVYGKDLGFTKKNRIILELPHTDYSNLVQFKNHLSSYPAITHVSYGLGAPASNHNMTTNFSVPGLETTGEMRLNIKPADTSYYRTGGLEVIAGEWYGVKHPGDSVADIVVNEKLISMIGMEYPGEAIGKHIYVGSDKFRICGVVRDFHHYSLYDPITPLGFIYSEQYFRRAIVGFMNGKEKDAINHIESGWQKFFPLTYKEFENYELRLKRRYIGERKILDIVLFFSVIAILIGCLGLFGLVSVTVVQKSREIGIRKIMGAQKPQILGLLGKAFLRWILLANVIAWPLAYYALMRWLENFSYRISFHWWVFFAAAALSLFVAALSILYHALSAASVNPVESIKYE